MYTKEDVLSYVAEEEIKFIRLAFCDIFGKEKKYYHPTRAAQSSIFRWNLF